MECTCEATGILHAGVGMGVVATVRALPTALETVVVGTVVVSNVVVEVVAVDVYFGTMAKVRPVFEESRVASHPVNS